MKVPELPVFGSKIQYSDILFVIFLLFYIYELVKEKRKIKVPFLLPIAFLLVSFLISFVFNEHHLKEIIEYTGIVYLVVLYLAIALLIRDEEYLYKCLLVWIWMSSAVCIIGITGYIIGVFSGTVNFFTPQIQSADKISGFPKEIQFYLRISSTFKNPNMFASYLIASITFIFMIIKNKIIKNKDRRLYVFILILHLLSALLTKSRIIGPVFLLFTLGLFILYPANKYILLKTSAIFLMSFFLILSFMTLVFWVFPIQTNPLKINTKKSEYFILSKAALKMWKDHPIIGVGLGRYNINLNKYIDWNKAKEALPDPDDISWKSKDPHSTYLGWASETGILGLLAILGFLWFNIKGSWCREDTKIIVLGISVYMIAGFSVDILTMRHFWFLLGINAVSFS
jgi:O-antigen ligase